jgi:hypothetical protein
MKISVRPNVFETNSSSTHCLVIVSKSDWEKFKEGKFLYNRWDEELVPNNANRIEDEDIDEDKYLTYEQFWGIEYETFEYSYTTENGDEIVAFGYYGYDG